MGEVVKRALDQIIRAEENRVAPQLETMRNEIKRLSDRVAGMAAATGND